MRMKRQSGVMLVMYAIIAVCVCAYIWEVTNPSLVRTYALTTGTITDGDYLTLLTSMFMHGGITHLAMNMLSLWFVAKSFGKVINGCEFLLAYMVSGIASGIVWCVCAMMEGSTSYCVGASGAIFGLLGVYGTMLLRMRKVRDVSSAIGSFVEMLVLNLVIGLVNTNIAIEGHVGGFIAGLLIGTAMMSRKDLSHLT